MKKSFNVLFGLMLTCGVLYGQSFSISPSTLLLDDTIAVDQSSTLQFDLANLTNDDLLLSWDLVELDFPHGWDYNICDYMDCILDPFPSHSDMHPIPALLSDGVYMKLWVSPEGIEGYGTARFYVRETNNSSVGDTITYHILASGYSGIDEQLANNLIVYPNPVDNELQIKGLAHLGQKDVSVELIDQLGISHSVKEATNESYRIDRQRFSSGIYFLRITMENQSATKKILLK